MAATSEYLSLRSIFNAAPLYEPEPEMVEFDAIPEETDGYVCPCHCFVWEGGAAVSCMGGRCSSEL